MLRALLLRLALPAALAASGAALASPPGPLVEMSIVDRDSGQWLAPVGSRGQDWIAGTPGHRYGIRLTNLTGQRVLAVLSVDGVNAISGQTAHPSQTGYVLEPWQTAQIDGWRKSLDHVAQFVFTDLPDSYAARTGRPDNVGVIGVAVFEEAVRWRDEVPVGIAGKASPAAPAAESRSADSAARQSIGTGHGQREWSQASRTDFMRATRTPAQVTQLRYDDRATLVALGVLPRHDRRRHVHGPRAFPEGFVADPPRD